jgi:DNA-binding NtrC family response regulator
MLVFIIEREEKTASFLSSILEEAGFTVRIFSETATVFEADMNQEPALIILDEVLAQIGIPEWPEVYPKGCAFSAHKRRRESPGARVRC